MIGSNPKSYIVALTASAILITAPADPIAHLGALLATSKIASVLAQQGDTTEVTECIRLLADCVKICDDIATIQTFVCPDDRVAKIVRGWQVWKQVAPDIRRQQVPTDPSQQPQIPDETEMLYMLLTHEPGRSNTTQDPMMPLLELLQNAPYLPASTLAQAVPQPTTPPQAPAPDTGARDVGTDTTSDAKPSPISASGGSSTSVTRTNNATTKACSTRPAIQSTEVVPWVAGSLCVAAIVTWLCIYCTIQRIL